jgi:hypothetical protein
MIWACLGIAVVGIVAFMLKGKKREPEVPVNISDAHVRAIADAMPGLKARALVQPALCRFRWGPSGTE